MHNAHPWRPSFAYSIASRNFARNARLFPHQHASALLQQAERAMLCATQRAITWRVNTCCEESHELKTSLYFFIDF